MIFVRKTMCMEKKVQPSEEFMDKYNNNKNNNNFKRNKFTNFVNEQIHSKSVHVVNDGNGNDIGFLPTNVAISKAKQNGLDLVQIAFSNGVSICRICDHGKFLYEQKQKQKMAKKQAKNSMQDLKEICFSIRIDDNDKNVKINHIKKFLAENCKVKITMQFQKREMNMLNYGKDIMKSILNELNGIAILDTMPKAENRSIFCIVKPIKK